MTSQTHTGEHDLAVTVDRPKPRTAPSDSRTVPRRHHRVAATTAGVLYITGTAAGILSVAVTAPLKDVTDTLATASSHQGAVVTGALLVLLMGLSLAFIPIVLFPILRPINEVLAVGYLVIRGAVETTFYILIAVGWLLLDPLAKVSAAADTGSGVGDILVKAEGANAVMALVFCLGAALFYVLLYRSRIVPRWISVWGLAAIPVYVAATLLAMYGVLEAGSTTQMLLFLALGVQEMVLAVWMIARGFRPVEEI